MVIIAVYVAVPENALISIVISQGRVNSKIIGKNMNICKHHIIITVIQMQKNKLDNSQSSVINMY